MCTYPRTDSKYLTDDIAETAEEIIEAVRTKFFQTGYDFVPNIKVLLNSAELVEKVEKSRRTINRITISLTDKFLLTLL